MTRDTDEALAFVAACAQYALCNSFSGSDSSASTSASSVWSDATSQSSDDDLSGSVSGSDSDSCDGHCRPKPPPQAPVESAPALRRPPPPREADPVAPELRLNPRRTAAPSHAGRLAAPPILVRQSDRRINFVDSLVGRFRRSPPPPVPITLSPPCSSA
ncbi:hypothetical protein CDD83_10851 [Cordyceps sp. RAO-2017]|nr:hypothetical protein CDD83_10851 [Cordyceps sp. RAO-2017]